MNKQTIITDFTLTFKPFETIPETFNFKEGDGKGAFVIRNVSLEQHWKPSAEVELCENRWGGQSFKLSDFNSRLGLGPGCSDAARASIMRQLLWASVWTRFFQKVFVKGYLDEFPATQTRVSHAFLFFLCCSCWKTMWKFCVSRILMYLCTIDEKMGSHSSMDRTSLS